MRIGVSIIILSKILLLLSCCLVGCDEYWGPYRNLYEKIVIDKENVVPTWINASDIETDLTEE